MYKWWNILYCSYIKIAQLYYETLITKIFFFINMNFYWTIEILCFTAEKWKYKKEISFHWFTHFISHKIKLKKKDLTSFCLKIQLLNFIKKNISLKYLRSYCIRNFPDAISHSMFSFHFHSTRKELCVSTNIEQCIFTENFYVHMLIPT